MGDNLEQPSIELFGLIIQEPMVTFTDLWITGVCVFAFLRLLSLNKKGAVHQYIRYYFLIMAVATLLGGLLGHAFQDWVGLKWKLPGWLISMLAVMSIERATIMHAKPVIRPALGKFLNVFNLIELTIFATLAFSTLNFFYIQVHSAYGLGMVVLPLHFMVYRRTRNEGSRIFILTVLFATLAAFFYTSKIGLHKWFNHLDLAHTIMAISMYFFYRGARKFEVLSEGDKLDKAETGDLFTVIKEAFRGVSA